jgi:hypothetical protein
MSQIYLRPADPAAIIRDPHTKRALPADGGRVPSSSYWLRQIRSGAVVHATEPAALPDQADPETTT